MEDPKSAKLSNLLLKAGLLQQQEICDAMEIAESLKKPLDQVLMTSGFMNSELSQNCHEAISYIDRGLITDQLVIEGLRIAHQKGLRLRDGLKYLGWGW